MEIIYKVGKVMQEYQLKIFTKDPIELMDIEFNTNINKVFL